MKFLKSKLIYVKQDRVEGEEVEYEDRYWLYALERTPGAFHFLKTEPRVDIPKSNAEIRVRVCREDPVEWLPDDINKLREIAKRLGMKKRKGSTSDFLNYISSVASQYSDIFLELAEPKKEEKPADIQERVEEEVERVLNSSNPLNEVCKHLDNIIAGEWANKKLIFLLLLSGRLADPKMKQMILITGESGGGKSTLMKVADLFKTKSIGRFTPHALDWSELGGYEVLKLKEIGLMDQESQGVSNIKFLSADDQGYTVEYPVRDESGRMVTEERRIPPITVITSTTRVKIDPQFERRSWSVTPDESEAQTKRIAEFKAKQVRDESDVKLGLKPITNEDFSRMVLEGVVGRIGSPETIVPFPAELTNFLGTKPLRVRGDYSKVQHLVGLYALMNMRNHTLVRHNGSDVLFANPVDAIEALRVAEEPLRTMHTKLAERIRRLVSAFRDLGINDEYNSIDKSKRLEIAKHMDLTERTVKVYLNELAREGYASIEGGGRGREITYYLEYPLDVIEGKKEKVGRNDFFQLWLPRFAKEGRKYLSSRRKKLGSSSGIDKVMSVYDACLRGEITHTHQRGQFPSFETGEESAPDSGKERGKLETAEFPTSSNFPTSDVVSVDELKGSTASADEIPSISDIVDQDDNFGKEGKCAYCKAPAAVWTANGTPLCDECAERYGGDL